jgi:hypothetical protein
MTGYEPAHVCASTYGFDRGGWGEQNEAAGERLLCIRSGSTDEVPLVTVSSLVDCVHRILKTLVALQQTICVGKFSHAIFPTEDL